jgi:sugar/nucleoside kinase (ribokinase family)
VVVVGAASRDRVADDPRGWRLGGAVSYGALAVARLGLRAAALIGTDAQAADAEELATLREAGVEVRVAPLASGPVFDNIEEPGGRRQVAYEAAAPLPVDALPPEWQSAPAWLLGPVAGELPDGWADVPPGDALVAVGWQGLLRDVRAGEPVRHLAPGPSPLLRRADVVAVSGTDFGPDTRIDDVCAWLRPGATLLVTNGARGGLAAEVGPEGPRRLHRYPSLRPDAVVDPTGAGDVFLATFLAARARPDLVGGRIAQRYDLLLAAAAASLLVEGPGLAGVPGRDAIRQRMAEASTRGASGRAV